MHTGNSNDFIFLLAKTKHALLWRENYIIELQLTDTRPQRKGNFAMILIKHYTQMTRKYTLKCCVP